MESVSPTGVAGEEARTAATALRWASRQRAAGSALGKNQDAGYEVGYEKGYEAGYGAGFAAGLASCPGPHGGG